MATTKDKHEPKPVKNEWQAAEDDWQAAANALVPMVKDGETLAVHPTCVKAHEGAGWRVA